MSVHYLIDATTAPANQPYGNSFGYEMTVGSSPIAVSALGAFLPAGTSWTQPKVITIYRSSDAVVLATQTIQPAEVGTAATTAVNKVVYKPITPVTIPAGTVCRLAAVYGGGDNFSGGVAPVSDTDSGAVALGQAYFGSTNGMPTQGAANFIGPSIAYDLAGATPATGSGGVFAFDTESGPAGTLAQDHPLTGGGSWTKDPGSTGDMVLTAHGTSRTTTGLAVYLASGTPASADYDVEEDVYFGTVSNYRFVIARGGTTGGGGGFCGWDHGGYWRLTIGAQPDFRYTPPTFPVAGSTHHVKLQCRGNAIAMFVDDMTTPVLTGTNTAAIAAGKAGIYGVQNTGTGNDGGGVQGKNFRASNPPAGPTPSLVVTSASGTAVDGTGVAVTATLANSSATLSASVSGGGTISTAAPSGGTAFTYSPPISGSGTATIAIVDATDGLTASVAILYHSVPTLTAKVSDGGGFVVVHCADPAGPEAAVASLGSFAGATVTVDGATTPLTQPLYGARLPSPSGVPAVAPYSPDLLFPMASPIAPTSAVTLNLPAGLVATTAGTSVALPALAVTNPGVLSSPRSLAARTFQVGYNISGDYYGSAGRTYSNFAKGATIGLGGNFLAVDANGYPTKLAGYSCQIPIAAPAVDYGGAGKGTPLAPAGRWRVRWKGVRNTFGLIAGANTTGTKVSETLVPGGVNETVFDIRGSDFSTAWSLALVTPQSSVLPDGTYPCDVTALEVFPPDPADPTGNTAWANPPKYYPTHKAQFGGGAWWRNMDGFPIIGSNAQGVADLAWAARAEYTSSIRDNGVGVVRVEPYTGTSRFVKAAGNNRVLVTTSAPHGYVTGMVAAMGPGVGTIHSTTGDFAVDNAPGLIEATSPTTFVFPVFAGGPVSAMTGVLTPAGPGNYVTAQCKAGGYGWDDYGNISAELDAHLHCNIPRLFPDAEVAKVFANLAATMPAGKKVRLELSNECWNDYSPEKAYFTAMSRKMIGVSDDYQYLPYQVYRSVQAHRAGMAAWVAGGRLAADFQRYIASAPGSDGSRDILALCKGPLTLQAFGRPDGSTAVDTVDLINGVTTTVTTPAGGGPAVTTTTTYPGLGPVQVDAVGPALYLDNNPFNEPTLAAAQANLTVSQYVDLFVYYLARNPVGSYLKTHKDVIAAAALPYPVQLVMYEFNVQAMTPYGQALGTADPKPIAIHRHPDMGGKVAAMMFDQLNAAGVDQGCLYYMNGGNYNDEWGVYTGISMVAGTGDPARDAANVASPSNLPLVVSEIGGAVNRWMALVNPSPIHKRLPPRPGGRPRTSGFRAW